MEILSEEKVLEEIERLKQSPYVKLAKKTENQAQRQKLYQLRSLEKKQLITKNEFGEYSLTR